MAKPKRSAADLDAELAALEAELAEMEQRKAKPKPKPAPAPAPAPEAPAAPAPAAEAEPREKKPRFGLKLPKREKPAVAGPVAPEPTAPAPAPRAQARPAPVAPAPTFDASLWREEDGAWVRTVPGTTVVVRRVLDENGNLVREEPATPRDLEEETPVKAERGLGRLLRRKGK